MFRFRKEHISSAKLHAKGLKNSPLGAFGNGSHFHHRDESEIVVNCGAMLSRVH